MESPSLVETVAVRDEAAPASKTPAASAAARRWQFFFRVVPAFDSLRNYSWAALRADLAAGLTVAAVALPQGMAYALAAGLPPQYGLYTAIVMTSVGALFDSSRQLINGPTNAISIAVFSALTLVVHLPGEAASVSPASAAILLAFMVGIVQTGITLFRLGDLTRYVSQAVIVGFTFGAAVLLVLEQVKHLLGLRPGGAPSPYFLGSFWHALSAGGPIHGWTAAIGLETMALVLGLDWLSKRVKVRLPSLLLAIVAMATVVWLGDLSAAQEGVTGVAVVGPIPRALPAFEPPPLNWTLLRALSPSALAIALLGMLEALAMAKAIAARTGQKLDVNQQCLSEGLANLSGSFFQCYPGSGSLTRSAINQQAGAVSQWSGVFSAVAVAVTILLLAPLAGYIPRAALAGILIISAWRLIDRKQLVYYLRATRFDALIVVATAVSAVFVSIEFCVLIGVFLSFILFVPKAARLHLTELTVAGERVIRERMVDDPPCDRILIYSLEGELFFGSAPDLEDHLATIAGRAAGSAKDRGDRGAADRGVADRGVGAIVLRMKRVRNPDAVCLRLLEDFLDRMAARHIPVFLCGVRRDLFKVLRASRLEQRLGPHRIFREQAGRSSTLDAVRAAYDILGGDLCASCPRRGETATKEVLYYMI